MRPQEGTCLTIFPPPLFTGWRLFGQLPERLRARVGDTVCRVCGGGRGVLVLRRGELFVRHRANVGQETVAILANLLEVHQSDVFVCEFYWAKMNVIRSLRMFSFQCILVFSLLGYEAMLEGEYEYPEWSVAAGWILTLSSVLCIPLYAIYKFMASHGDCKDVSIE